MPHYGDQLAPLPWSDVFGKDIKKTNNPIGDLLLQQRDYWSGVSLWGGGGKLSRRINKIMQIYTHTHLLSMKDLSVRHLPTIDISQDANKVAPVTLLAISFTSSVRDHISFCLLESIPEGVYGEPVDY